MQDVIFLLLFTTSGINGASLLQKHKGTFNESLLPKLPSMIEEAKDNLIDNPLTKLSIARRFAALEYTKEVEMDPDEHWWFYETLMRHAFDERFSKKYGTTYDDRTRICYTIVTTYLGAMQDLRKYYEVRYLYLNNLEYEVGYMVHEIVYKYQKMIELFALMRKKYVYQIKKNVAPTKYMLYIYSNIVELSKVVIHLCNMLHELQFKYGHKPPKSAFEDVQKKNKTVISEKDIMVADNTQWENYIKIVEEKQREEKKKKERILAMNRKGVKLLTPWTNSPRRGTRTWPLVYGWSIEDW